MPDGTTKANEAYLLAEKISVATQNLATIVQELKGHSRENTIAVARLESDMVQLISALQEISGIVRGGTTERTSLMTEVAILQKSVDSLAKADEKHAAIHELITEKEDKKKGDRIKILLGMLTASGGGAALWTEVIQKFFP